MSFPSELARNTDLVRAPSVIGCGLLWPDGVFFTLDGVYNNTVYPFRGVEFEEGECLPYITYPTVKVNYGQEEFLMERANAQRLRLASSQLLHSFSRHLLAKLMWRLLEHDICMTMNIRFILMEYHHDCFGVKIFIAKTDWSFPLSTCFFYIFVRKICVYKYSVLYSAISPALLALQNFRLSTLFSFSMPML